MDVFWTVAPCSLLQIYKHFKSACRLHHQGGFNNAKRISHIINLSIGQSDLNNNVRFKCYQTNSTEHFHFSTPNVAGYSV